MKEPKMRSLRVWLWIKLTSLLGMNYFVDWESMAVTRDAQDKRAEVPMHQPCECCGKGKSVVVACVPGVPMSIAWCERCFSADVVPYGVAVAQVATLGGLDNIRADFRDYLIRSVKYHEKTDEEFAADVKKAQDDLDQYTPPAESEQEL